MKSDSYMPFYGDEFFQAVKGKDELTSMAYLRAIWHYWSHLHCKGFGDNQEELRRICEVDKADWERVCASIFDNDQFFTLDEVGLWRQKKADELWAIAQRNYKANIARATGGARERWKDHIKKVRKGK